jgi:hypothetical protein
VHPATCANCDAPLTGPYCAGCGQHARESVRTVGALFHDAWHVLTHLDGRFWQTLAALLLRPGRLTQEYFAEHRARYLPPVRLYLVLSVLFFALSPLRSGRVADSGAAVLEHDPAVAADLEDARREYRQARNQPVAPGAPVREPGAATTGSFDAKDCDRMNVSPTWLAEPLRTACRRHAADDGKAMLRAFGANIPKMMFVFLPIMALVMLPLYWRPRRYYVEHLVFFLHTHAALFLVLLLELLLSRLVAWLPALRDVGGIVLIGGMLYAVWYVYRALRVYYAQGRARTLAKLTVVSCAYMIFLAVTLAATLVVSALTA